MIQLKVKQASKPVQFRWSDDSKFLSDQMKKNSAITRQITDSISSIDEANCEALIAPSDTELLASLGPSGLKTGSKIGSSWAK